MSPSLPLVTTQLSTHALRISSDLSEAEVIQEWVNRALDCAMASLITIPQGDDLTLPVVLGLISDLRARSASLVRTFSQNQRFLHQAQYSSAKLKEEREAFYRDFLTNDHWVKAGASADERKARAELRAEQQVRDRLSSLNDLVTELTGVDKVLQLAYRDLEAARKDLDNVVQTLRIGLRLQT